MGEGPVEPGVPCQMPIVSSDSRAAVQRGSLLSVPEGQADGSTDVVGGLPRRHPLISGGDFIQVHDKVVGTLYENLRHAVHQFRDHDFLGSRKVAAGDDGGEEVVVSPYVFETYGHVWKRVGDLAAGLHARLQLPERANVGLYSVNRVEWLLAEQACFANNWVTVPLYDTLGEDAIVHIVGETEMAAVVVAREKIAGLLKLKERLGQQLRYLVCMDGGGLEEGLEGEARGLGLEILYLGDLEASGRAADFAPRPPSPDDLCTICYTSGTTGTPKGVMLSHRAILASASAALRMLQAPQKPGKGPLVPLATGAEAYLSYLPLAHIFERVVMVAMIAIGAKIGFYQGDVLRLMDDLAALRPTIFVSVPRLFNRLYDKVLAGVKERGAVAQWLFSLAFDAKLAALRKDGALTHWLYDRLVFSAIRERLGGRVKVMITGSAPLAGRVMDFLRVVFSCHVLEGYGMTETAAVSCLTCPGDLYCPQLGVPSPCVEVRLVDIPEMGYTARDSPRPRGEIWVRGPACFSGYYKAEDKTAEALTPDGWVVTGDVGEWDEAGRLLMIDRRKCLFKLAQGEYVSPERVEAVLARHPLVAQAFVEGNSLKSYVVAVVVPDVPRLLAWYAQLKGIECSGMDLSSLIASDPALPGLLAKELGQALGSRGSGELKGFEVPRALHLEPEAFSVDNGLLTPTFKLRRNVAKARYAPVLSALYETLE